jgi:hypothetical protein
MDQETALAKLHMRSFAYKQVFGCKAILTRPWWMFWARPKTSSLSESGQFVIKDLARYCHANEISVHVKTQNGQFDPIAMAFAEGQRDVYNRISGLLNLDHEQILRNSQRN